MKKLFLIALFAFSYTNVQADVMADLELSNSLLAYAEYGGKTNWSSSELKKLEGMVNKFSDDTLKQVWISNIVTYALMGSLPSRPSSEVCKIAKRNISKIQDGDIRSLWNTNYRLYGC